MGLLIQTYRCSGGLAVAVWRDVQYQGDMEMRTSVDDCLRIFCHFVIQQLRRMIISRVDSIEVTSSNASSTTHTILGVYLHLHGFLVELQATVGTLEHTALASTAFRLADFNLSADMLVALAGT